MLLGIKRIYDHPELTDGKRILVDKLWPRGVRKSTARVDEWIKDVAPSNELRQWFSHESQKWEEFKKKYSAELKKSAAVEGLVEIIKNNDVTLLYASRDKEHNNAVVLAEFLKERLEL